MSRTWIETRTETVREILQRITPSTDLLPLEAIEAIDYMVMWVYEDGVNEDNELRDATQEILWPIRSQLQIFTLMCLFRKNTKIGWARAAQQQSQDVELKMALIPFTRRADEDVLSAEYASTITEHMDRIWSARL